MRYDQTGYKICDRCGRRYYRSNLVRAWVVTNPGHRAGWIRAIQKLCCTCMKAAEALAMVQELNPRFRVLKPSEKIAGHTPPKRRTG